ncbi:MAG: DUF359 domain-containing protein [Candidatus Thermoplasmatota archaeon]
MKLPAGDLRLPDALRRELAAPFGPIVQTADLPAALAGRTPIIAVGDVVSLTLKRLGIVPRLFVCDFLTQRGEPDPIYEAELGTWGTFALRVRNPAGTLTRKAWEAVALALAEGQAPVGIIVEGEEDLFGIPCFALAPLGAVVLYGMPGKGVVVASVDAAMKSRVRSFVERMTP